MCCVRLNAARKKLMHPRFRVHAEIVNLLADAAIESAARLARTAESLRKAKPIGNTLKPGPDTPLWNELSLAVRSRLNRHGEKARLGRVLGIPRQRVHELFKKRTYMPDAERTLLLLVWLNARTHGQDLG